MDTVKKCTDELASSGLSFRSLYKVMKENFGTNIFASYINDGDVSNMTYNELFEKVEKTALCLSSQYGNKGDFIGLYMPNCVTWVVCFWAILMAGYKPLLLNPMHEKETTDAVIDMTSPVCVISDSINVKGAVLYSDIIARGGKDAADKWAEEVALITSGSSAFPKVIVHSGESICSQVMMTKKIIGQNSSVKHGRKEDVRILAFLPFCHVFGLVATLLWFTFFGRTLIFLPDYSPKQIRYACRRFRVTNFFAIPLVWNRAVISLLDEVESREKTKAFNKLIKISNSLRSAFPNIAPPILNNTVFKSIRKQVFGTELLCCISGGGFISDETMSILSGIGYPIFQGYGLTECGIISVNMDKRPSKRTADDCGAIFDTVDYKIGQGGELLINRKNCFSYQIKDGERIDNTEEYYDTGDRVKIKANGHLTLYGRADDIIIAENGENVSPEAVEQKLTCGIFDNAALMYINFAGKKQLVLAVARPDNVTAYSEAVSVCELFSSISKLPIYERPQTVIRVSEDVPRTIKSLDRRRLSKMLEEGTVSYTVLSPLQEKDIARYRGEEYEAILSDVKALFAAVTKKQPEEINDTSDYINDLSGDSIGYIELVGKITDKFNVEIRFEGVAPMTPTAFADYITDERNKSV